MKVSKASAMGQQNTVLHPPSVVLNLSLSRGPKTALHSAEEKIKGKFFFSFIKSGFHQMDTTARFTRNQITLGRRTNERNAAAGLQSLLTSQSRGSAVQGCIWILTKHNKVPFSFLSHSAQ